MKKLFIIFIFIAILVNSLTFKVPTSSELKMYVKDYKKSLREYGISYKDAFRNVKEIKVDSLGLMENGSDILGLYDPETQTVYIDRIVIQIPVLARAVVYHELGHSTGMPHSCASCPLIMSANAHVDNIIKYYSITPFWEKQKKLHFEVMKLYLPE